MADTQQVRMYRTDQAVPFTGANGQGAVGTIPLYSVTGRVMIWAVIARCSADLVSDNGSVSMGIAGQPAIVAGTGTATTLVAGDIWLGSNRSDPLADAIPYFKSWDVGSGHLLEDDDLVLTVTDAGVTAGQLDIEVFWSPFSTGGSLSAT